MRNDGPGFEPWVVVAVADERRSAELALVLAAKSIEYERVFTGRGWTLSVPAARAAEAAAEIAAYGEENRPERPPPPIAEIGSGRAGVIAYWAVLLAVFAFNRRDLFGFDWLGAGRLEADAVRAGEWWRAVTALTLHVDLDHLASNLAFGAFFGLFVCRYLGNGLGLAAILLAGTLGNLVNGFVQPGVHRAIGASTAVFGALGLLSGYVWRRGLFRRLSWRARAAPIVAGIALLAYTGTGGENTDIFAHLFGFVAGTLLGAGLAAWSPPTGEAAQRAYAAAAAAALAVAWGVALAWDG
ncbi:MAG TPA: rhomboid family intramembrane serine protease [Gammaproteobacteria bacterium]